MLSGVARILYQGCLQADVRICSAQESSSLKPWTVAGSHADDVRRHSSRLHLRGVLRTRPQQKGFCMYSTAVDGHHAPALLVTSWRREGSSMFCEQLCLRCSYRRGSPLLIPQRTDYASVTVRVPNISYFPPLDKDVSVGQC